MHAPRARRRIPSPSSLLTPSPATSVTDHFADQDIGGRTSRASGGSMSTTATTTTVWSDDKTEVPPATPLDYLPDDEDERMQAERRYEYDQERAQGWTGTGEVKEGRLIDLDDEDDQGQVDIPKSARASTTSVNPTQKLRELLREMERQAKEAVPMPAPAPAPEPAAQGPAWGRRTHASRSARTEVESEAESEASRPDREGEEEGDDELDGADGGKEEEEDEQSPPTPPPRIGNPYSRRVSAEKRVSPSFSQPHRLPSRAAVLLQSTSRSPEPAPSAPSPEPQPTPLQAFLASHPSDPSSSRLSRSQGSFSSSASGGSRKGKEREYERPPAPARSPVMQSGEGTATRRNRFRQQQQQYEEHQWHTPPVQSDQYRPSSSLRLDAPAPAPSTSRRPPPTPRRSSVDLAPDDSASFVRGLGSGGDGVQPEMELDLDEGLSAMAWEEMSASALSASSAGAPARRMEVGREAYQSDVDRTAGRTGVRPSISPQYYPLPEVEIGERSSTTRPRSRQTNLRPDTDFSHSRSGTFQYRHAHSQSPSQNSQTFHSANGNAQSSYSRLNQISSSHQDQREEAETSLPLPALPEPDLSASSTSSEDHRASRRAALFRSSSKSASASISTLTAAAVTSHSHSRGSNATAAATATSSFRSTQSRGSVSPVLPPRPALAGAGSSPPTRVSPSPRQHDVSHRERAQSSSVSPAQTQMISGRYFDLEIPPQQPIQVGLALTPQRLSTSPDVDVDVNVDGRGNGNGNVSMGNVPTPRPPGAWGTPVHAQKTKVRFSPLRKEVHASPPQESVDRRNTGVGTLDWEEGPSVHRLRVSPRKSPRRSGSVETHADEKDADVKDADGKEEMDPDMSWTARLSRSFTKNNPLPIRVPKPSTTLSQAQSALDAASARSKVAQANVELTQKQWLEALAAMRDVGVGGVRRGWNWGTWVWWVLMEVVLLWGVFRVTIDYATSTAYLTSFDPFHPLATPYTPYTSVNPLTAIGLPVPAGLSTFVNRSASGNFFDLLEAWGVGLVGAGAAGAGGGRMLGGVPT